MKAIKKIRHKAGWKELDRVCILCGNPIIGEQNPREPKKEQALIRHHLQYDPDFIKSLHFGCHEVVHARAKYHNPYTIKYGKDFGPVAMSFAILKMYAPVMLEIFKKYPELEMIKDDLFKNKD